VTPRNRRDRVNDILQAIDGIEAHHRRARSVGLPDDDPLLLDAVVRQLALIGEAAAHLPAEVIDRHPGIPWQGVKGMRLLLDHEYHRVDATIVWETVRTDLPKLQSALQSEQAASKPEPQA
jgi:uncharacterized protein with HEPN domain